MKTSLALLLLSAGASAGFAPPCSGKAASFELDMAKDYVPKGHFHSRPLADFQKDLEAGKVR